MDERLKGLGNMVLGTVVVSKILDHFFFSLFLQKSKVSRTSLSGKRRNLSFTGSWVLGFWDGASFLCFSSSSPSSFSRPDPPSHRDIFVD